MEEIWKSVLGYEGLYEVSNYGRIKSLNRKEKLRNGRIRGRKETMIKLSSDKAGYLICTLCKNGGKSTKTVHRIVAEAFIKNKFNFPQVNHIDGIKSNNYSSNLEFTTASENAFHAIGKGLRRIRNGEEIYCAKLSESEVKEIRYVHKELSHAQLSRMYNTSSTNIQSIRSGRTWKHI